MDKTEDQLLEYRFGNQLSENKEYNGYKEYDEYRELRETDVSFDIDKDFNNKLKRSGN